MATFGGILLYGKAYYTGTVGSIKAGFIYAGFNGMYLTCIYPWLFTKFEKRLEEKKQEVQEIFLRVPFWNKHLQELQEPQYAELTFFILPHTFFTDDQYKTQFE